MAKPAPRSPLAPVEVPHPAPLSGVNIGCTYAGIRYPPGRNDLLLLRFAEGTTMAGVYTRSRTASPAVHWCQQAQAATAGAARALLVVAGNSIAGTGAHGAAICQNLAQSVAQHLECHVHEVQISATGVIGEPMPADKLLAGLPALLADTSSWPDAAYAILTTDTFPKLVEQTIFIDDKPVRLVGFIKGSGMIEPDMATMLGYIITDASLPANVLQDCLNAAADRSFNCITVDSDTSTSDTVQLFATQQVAHPRMTEADDPRLADFRAALDQLCLDLAQLVVRDGEGAEKFITISVSGAASDADARHLAKSVANSPLVKTAIAGEDANWGRVVMAIGKTNLPIDPDRLCVAFGGTTICRDGMRVEGYDEAPVVAHLATRDIRIDIDVGIGEGQARVYTCDLTHGYISINGDYRS